MIRASRRTRSISLALVFGVLLATSAAIALAAHQFNDVPNSNPFHADIDALVDSGITGGCGGGNYCPKQNVTREQMAAFLNRLGALGPGKAPVINADRVDGRHASELHRMAVLAGTEELLLSPANQTYVQFGSTTVLVAPADGFAAISVRVVFRNPSCTSACEVSAFVFNPQSNWVTLASTSTVAADGYETVAISGVIPVSAGTNQFGIFVNRASFPTDGDLYATLAEGSVTYSPYGAAGNLASLDGDRPFVVDTDSLRVR